MDKKRGRPVKYKKVYCKETDTTYESCRHAAEELECHREKVYMTAKGLQKTHHGFHFEFI